MYYQKKIIEKRENEIVIVTIIMIRSHFYCDLQSVIILTGLVDYLFQPAFYLAE